MRFSVLMTQLVELVASHIAFQFSVIGCRYRLSVIDNRLSVVGCRVSVIGLDYGLYIYSVCLERAKRRKGLVTDICDVSRSNAGLHLSSKSVM